MEVTQTTALLELPQAGPPHHYHLKPHQTALFWMGLALMRSMAAHRSVQPPAHSLAALCTQLRVTLPVATSPRLHHQV